MIVRALRATVTALGFSNLLAVTLVLAIGGGARAQSATLNGYRAAELPDDGFVISGSRVAEHLELAGQLHLDYANDPLVYEDVGGRASSELVALVSDQMTTQLALALGLYDVGMISMVWPVNVLMQGNTLGDQPTATGFGSGDLRLSGRLGLYRSEGAAAGLQLTATFGTAEGGEGGAFTVNVDPAATSALFPGLYQLYLIASSDQVAQVAEQRVDLQIGV